MNSLMKYGLIALVIGGIYLYNNSDSLTYSEDDIDLNAVLDVTVDTIYAFQDELDQRDAESLDPDQTFVEFSELLQEKYNEANPALHTQPIAVMPRTDSAILAYDDYNKNQELDDSEPALFLVEIDGENSRVIASSRSGAVNDHHFSGTGILAGYLLGSMLSRQRMSGVDSKSLANKKTMTARQAAKSRAGSGSHSKGK